MFCGGISPISQGGINPLPQGSLFGLSLLDLLWKSVKTLSVSVLYHARDHRSDSWLRFFASAGKEICIFIQRPVGFRSLLEF